VNVRNIQATPPKPPTRTLQPGGFSRPVSPGVDPRSAAISNPDIGFNPTTMPITATYSSGGRTPAPVAEIPFERGPLNWRDAAYNSQIASIMRALQDFETGAQTRGERYGQDFMTGLNRLGYRPGEGFQAMPNILEMLGQGRTLGAGQAASDAVSLPKTAGMFDIEGQFDPYSAAARGTRGVRDEFAGRGTLRSSDFARTFGEFQNRLNQQLEAMETGRTRFGEDLVTEVSQERVRAQERQEAAQRDAMMRAAIAAATGMGF
jgi:hypothetical protein